MKMKCKNCKNLHILTDLKNEVIGKWCPNINDCPDIEIERECEYCDTMTNADKIRNMSNEELAEWLHNMTQFFNDDDKDELDPMISIFDLDKECEVEVRDSYGDLLEWLQKEVE